MLPHLRRAGQLVAILVLAACGRSEERGPDSADLRDPWVLPAAPSDPSHAAGRLIFASCASCHLADAGGRTDGTIPRLAGQAASILERRLRALSDGSVDLPVMVPFARALTEPEIHHVSAYLSSLPRPAQVGLGPGTQLARGLAVYGDRCSVCHAENAGGDPALNVPMLCGQHEAYLLRRLNEMAGADRRGTDPAMSAIAAALSPEDRRAVSDHLARSRCD